MIKNTTQGTHWSIHDTACNTYNVSALKNIASANEIENGASLGGTMDNLIDILSNGFKLRAVNTTTNCSGDNLIFMAFAEGPFKYSNAR